jgi:hypothetical protein
MTRTHGSIGTLPIECINPRYQKYRVRWDFKPSDDGDGVTFYEAEITYPTEEKIKEVVLAGYNAIIDERILTGFEWQGMKVWLSSENQFNYKAAYDLAVQTSGATLPVRFKFGTTTEPVYYTFTTVEEFTEFYMAAMVYINTTLEQGWAEKDAIDWSIYNIE